MENPGPGMKAVANETESLTSRTSKTGKKFTYQLKVIQQPLRARACGAGAKSSADRRPVDPPPIVELKIFEGSDASQQDVTFSINANYFLFATLEQARKQAHPRGVAAERNPPVLTGTPVAGMVCLERPVRAGYFIFPDLSVRHEGAYRLSFSLFEDLREPEDEDRADELNKIGGLSDGHATNRLEVKSQPFIVYSAKKFPGLTESTMLSRTVAEQGCRVRIRRDVRMRKPESKRGKDWEGYEDATAEERARMSATPEASNYVVPTPHGYDPVPRPRSGSNASYHSLAPSAHPSRRASMQEMNQAYHPAGYGTSPHTPHASYSQTSPYCPAQSQTYSQASFMQQQSAMQPPQPQYAHPSSYGVRPVTASQPAPLQQSYHNYGVAAPPPAMPQTSISQSQWSQPQSHYQQPHSYESQEQHHRSSMDYSMHYSHDHHRSSSQYSGPPSAAQYSAPPSAISADYNAPRNMQEPLPSHSSGQTYQQAPPPPPPSYPPQHSSSTPNHTYRPAPLEPVQPPTRTIGATTPLHVSGRSLFRDNHLPPLNTVNVSSASKALEPSSPAPLISQSQTTYSSSQPDAHKRPFDHVFHSRHHSQPLRYGQRPSTPGHSYAAFSPNDVDDESDAGMQDSKPLQYRRANGAHVYRAMEQQQGEFMADQPGM